MAGFIQNILWNSVEGFVEAGTRSVGQYAGDALMKAGDIIEETGRGVGTKIERSASAYGEKISGQTYQGPPGQKALPSTARRAVVKRSNSLPATASKAVMSQTPVGTRKYPGTTTSTSTPLKQITNGSVSRATSVVGSGTEQVKRRGRTAQRGRSIAAVTNGAAGAGQKAITAAPKGVTGLPNTSQKSIGGVTNGARNAISPASKALPRPYPNNVPYGTSTTPSATGAKKTGPTAVKPSNSTLPKPYPQPASTPSPYPAAKKTAVKPGQPKPFIVDNKTVKPPAKPNTSYKDVPTARPVGGKMTHIPLSGGIGGGGGGASTAPKTGSMGGLGNMGSSTSKAKDSYNAVPTAKPVGGKMQHIPI